MAITTFRNMLGKVMVTVSGTGGGDEMLFVATDGSRFRFTHQQDCCENVRIEDICGDLSDLVGAPIVEAEEVDNKGPKIRAESYTWTFYRFSSTKGTVTVRWLGTSNGYYGEGVGYDESEVPIVEAEEEEESLTEKKFYIPKF